eukprot:1348832-Amorphochlora_amoeboformis.AAC.1
MSGLEQSIAALSLTEDGPGQEAYVVRPPGGCVAESGEDFGKVPDSGNGARILRVGVVLDLNNLRVVCRQIGEH